MNIDNLWDNFLEKIKPRISSLSYDTWFKNTKLVSLDNNIAKILVDSPLQKKSLQERKPSRINVMHSIWHAEQMAEMRHITSRQLQEGHSRERTGVRQDAGRIFRRVSIMKWEQGKLP